LTTSIFSGVKGNCFNRIEQTWFKSVKGQHLLLPPSSFCSVCQPLNLNGAQTLGYSMNEHRTSLQHLNGHVVDTSHKDHVNTTQPQQPLLTDTISAEPCPQSSPQTDCDKSQMLQDSAPKDDFLENQGNQDSILQPLITPEQQPLSPDRLSLSPASPLLCFSEKMLEPNYPTLLLQAPRYHPKKRLCLQFSRKATLAESQTSSVSNLIEMCPDIQTHLTSTS